MGVDIQTYRAKIGTYRRSNGVDVVTVVLVVNFSHGLKAIGSVLFIGLLLVMAGIETNPGPREQDLASQQSDEILSTSDIPTNEKVPEEVLETLPTPTKIQLSGLPDIMNQKLLEIFFENEEKSGGGKVKEVKVCGTNSAIIEFEETSAVEFIMQNLPLSILGTEVHVKVIETKLTENKPPKTIKVTELPKGITNDILKLFFESENRQGGGKVVDVTIDHDRNSAIVEFEEATAVDKVMGKRPIKLLGAEVNVEVFVSVENNDNIPPTKLRVKGLLPIMTAEVLTLFFENENQQGGGRVKGVTLDTAGNSAVVEFEEAAAVKVVMAKQPISIFGTNVEVDVIDDETNLKQPKSGTIKVSGLPKSTQEEMLIMFFENEKRQGGGKVTDVFINEKEGSALVEFEEDQAVESVLEKRPINFLGCEVKVERYVPPMQMLSEIESTKLLVTNLPENVTEDVLVMFFENEKRQGGGDVKEVTMDKKNGCAVVEFEEAKALEKVLQKRPIIIMGREVNVNVFDGEYPQTTQNTMLVVSGLPRDMSVDFLTMFFENEKRFGGGPVKHVEIKEDTNSAMIDFEEPEAVTIVMKKQPIIIHGTEVHISTFVQEPETQPSKGTQLKVSGLPEKISQEYLVMFFENEQRQGGGKVKSVEINEVTRSAIIQFEEDKAVETVLRKRPITIQNKEVHVVKVCTDVTDPPIECSKIKVSCLPSGVTEEYLVLFFENERGYGGGPVKHIEIDQIDRYAVIEFEKQQAVFKVLEKKPIVLLGQNVTVEIFDEVEEPTVMLVSGLPDDVSEEFLVMFFENEKRQGGGNVKTVEINANRRLAIIEFETSDSLKKVIEKRPILISGKECEISVFDGSSTIEVRGYTADKSIEKQLLQYFENTSLSGGENVQSIRVNKDTGVALVSFLRHEVVKRICEQKHHRLNQSTLIVNTYVPTSTSSECKQIPQAETIYSRDQAQDSSDHLSNENTKPLSEQISSEGKPQEEDTSQSKDGRDKADDKVPTQILVKGIPDNMTENYLTFFFEDVKRKGGGKVKAVDLNSYSHYAVIEFESHKALEKVLQNIPIEITGTEVEVSLFGGSNTIEVRGFSPVGSIETILWQYFEDTEKSGGEGVASVKFASDERVAFVTFNDNEAARRVCRRKLHALGEDLLVVNIHIHSDLDSVSKQDQASTAMTDINALINLLEIKELLQSKIKVKDVLMTDPSLKKQKSHNSIKDLPWLFLQQLLSVNSSSMDLRMYNLQDNMEDEKADSATGSVLAMYKTKHDSDILSPLDLFLLVFQCCDPELKQLLYQKLYLCKLAVPFLYQDVFSSKAVVSVWPLHSIVIENKTKTASTLESEVLEMPTKIISFARFGRPKFSKSKLLNGLLCDYSMDTFFHKDCQSGMTSRILTNGYVEMFWFPSIGETGGRFTEPMTFLNMRGDLKNGYDENKCSFISDISDAIAIVTDIMSVTRQTDELQKVLKQFKCVLLIIASPLNRKDTKTQNILLELESSITKRDKTNITIICTHTGDTEKNPLDMVTEVLKYIVERLKIDNKPSCSLQERLTNKITTDESSSCMEAKALASSLIKSMAEVSKQECMTSIITPIQYILSTKLGKHLREISLKKDVTMTEKNKTDISAIRSQQTSKITEPVRLFIKHLMKCAQTPHSLHYFLGWLNLFLEHKKRTILSQLMVKNKALWEKYRKMKKEGKPTPAEINEQETLIKESECRIEEASFGIIHFFREVSHLYDSFLVLRIDPARSNLPKADKVAEVFAKLIINGYTFELLDGNSFFMPSEWIKLTLGRVHCHIGKSKVLALSVLGLQSSGKSTLLNTMFGVQFPSSAGRCTRGIHAQLLPLALGNDSLKTYPFKYVLVIDTEGLRAPELNEKNYKRDNELATIITGLGDITLLNIMGENTMEIRDILQVIVHAFLRLKLANNKLDIKKGCVLIHQNVTDISASEKMKTGLELTVRNLDCATRESAESEGIADITTFEQVIEFNTDKNVWYLPNLWKGNPPMAQINRKYSERVVAINHELVARALNDKTKSFKTLEDIVLHTDDLWKGVLAENFIFSFKNSLEKKAYISLEKRSKDELWNLESSVDEQLFKLVQNNFSQCQTQEKLQQAKRTVMSELQKIIADKEAKITRELEVFFDKNDYTDTTIQWKGQTMNQVRSFCSELLGIKRPEIERTLNRRAFEIMSISSHEKHEEKLRKRSIDLANQIRGKHMSENEIDAKFDEIWNSFVQESFDSCNLKTPDWSLKDQFITCLSDMFRQHPVLFQILNEHDLLQKRLPNVKLSRSFQLTNVRKEDISIKSKMKEYVSNLINYSDSAFKVAVDRLEVFFVTVDTEIERQCKTDREITGVEVRKFLNFVHDKLNKDMIDPADNFTLKTTFIIKTIVHVSNIGCCQFEEHNKEYQRNNGLQVRIARYRIQCKERFNSHLHERNAEYTAAVVFRHAVENFVRETVKDSISVKVKHTLKGELPQMKYHLIIEMLRELVRKNKFESFVYYITSPKSYADVWLTSKSDKFLFSSHDSKYFQLASTEVNLCLTDIRTAINISSDFFKDASPSVKTWLQKFFSAAGTYKFPEECFREVERELEQSKQIDVGNYKTMLLKELEIVENGLLKEFKSVTSETVKWRGFNPFEVVFTDIWGCAEQCVFCGEPCANGSPHSTSNHNCIQHRPNGCKGVYDFHTRKIWLRTCNYDVTTDVKADCSCYKYMCNPSSKEPCPLKEHPMKDYKKIIPRWEIKPTNDMEDRSQFWLWFMATYKKDLGDYYKIDVSNVPSSWGHIQKDVALDSLGKLYC